MRIDDVSTPSRALAKKKKYFSEKQNNKNIFKKLLHPSYHERSAQYRRLFGGKIGPEPDDTRVHCHVLPNITAYIV
ncbi:unnamed protein product [Strongylus vulgaris]|uniref:Uncharacterized protein n=1 Tax=Strongylus vulgaris TaxID=40348 RepID=A0A3P7L8G1_STRVU|nr:unnamed protein product [Strongylus vulgaris]